MGLSRQMPVLDLPAVHVERLRNAGLLRRQSAIPVPGTGPRPLGALLKGQSIRRMSVRERSDLVPDAVARIRATPVPAVTSNGARCAMRAGILSAY